MGDLHVIKNNVLRKLFTKEPKLREFQSTNFPIGLGKLA